MKLDEVRAVAKSFGLKTAKRSKIELIKMIQNDGGNFDCYASALGGECDQAGCFWREDCFDDAREQAGCRS
jgi:hypothetical protein